MLHVILKKKSLLNLLNYNYSTSLINEKVSKLKEIDKKKTKKNGKGKTDTY